MSEVGFCNVAYDPGTYVRRVLPSKPEYVFGRRVLCRAAAVVLSERTAHEGLLRADQQYLRWLNTEVDLPPRFRKRVDAWRAALFGGRRQMHNLGRLLQGLRELAPAQAEQHARALVSIADEARTHIPPQS